MKRKPTINWTLIEAEVLELRTARLPPEEKLRRARELAEIYLGAGKPLPPYIAAIS